MTFLILNGADFDNWTKHHGGGLCIPVSKRPAVLQPDRKAGEIEALRLARLHPSGMFVLFAPVAIAMRMAETTHVNLRGEPIRHANVARLVPIAGSADDDTAIPF